ncbi:MAG: cytochrome B [Candidatus Dactylopiibacterium carminicum]|uniref:Cytochrome B n=1 Tax=Candidatus Dactylopiibacterium carminicum TaxID=857335 RepID=A0A272EP95_9RHOO|nr:cytochrome b/b6 domain-containing protein [Candidatus Dactylopiibacterium carminicum]KAF7598273.1 cytochrome b [Candidatus Dactylopiibacterium carminicum]PAS91929.1 MAG: cytochrome B [Candidatus Dactylopiibacterium carminicum]PAS95010.1 MAG: cytochrome B [Candidatus Dactylopiibacterium carminicum]PAS97156.1 MAG: hypothetical protein BSR46_14345 [Candidatus Dactylopiibacterium carminicum]
MQPVRHHLAIRVLHWAVAVMVIAALAMSTFIMSQIPDEDPEKMASALRHMSVGLLICIGTLVRLFWRRRVKRLPSLSSGMPWADVLAGIVHRGLDVLVLTMIISGIAMAVQLRLPLMALRGEPFPSEIVSLFAFTVHVVGAFVLTGALLMHIGGALYHQFILKDGLLSRMGFDLPLNRPRFTRHFEALSWQPSGGVYE